MNEAPTAAPRSAAVSQEAYNARRLASDLSPFSGRDRRRDRTVAAGWHTYAAALTVSAAGAACALSAGLVGWKLSAAAVVAAAAILGFYVQVRDGRPVDHEQLLGSHGRWPKPPETRAALRRAIGNACELDSLCAHLSRAEQIDLVAALHLVADRSTEAPGPAIAAAHAKHLLHSRTGDPGIGDRTALVARAAARTRPPGLGGYVWTHPETIVALHGRLAALIGEAFEHDAALTACHETIAAALAGNRDPVAVWEHVQRLDAAGPAAVRVAAELDRAGLGIGRLVDAAVGIGADVPELDAA